MTQEGKAGLDPGCVQPGDIVVCAVVSKNDIKSYNIKSHYDTRLSDFKALLMHVAGKHTAEEIFYE